MGKLGRHIRRIYFRTMGAILRFLVDRLYGADLLWNKADPEVPYYSLREMVNELGDFNSFVRKEGSFETVEFNVERAFTLPLRRYEVTPFLPDPENQDDIEYKIRKLPRSKP